MSGLLGNRMRTAVEEAIVRARLRDERRQRAERILGLNWRLFGPRWRKGLKRDRGFRPGSCGRRRDSRVKAGRSVGADGEQVGVLEGLESCLSAYCCPRCAPKIRAGRAKEIEQILSAHLAAGGHAAFVTLTTSHTAGESSAATLDDVMRCWSKMIQTRRWKALAARWGISGFMRAVEDTLGDHGWHCHIHAALLLDRERQLTFDEHGDGELEQMRREIDELWRYQAEQLGRQVHHLHGVDLEPIRDAEGIGKYLSKVAMELVRSDLKNGRGKTSRSPFQLAYDASAPDADPQDVALWVDYATGCRGRRLVEFSKGLLARFGIRHVSDETLGEERPATEAVAWLDGLVFDAVAKHLARYDLKKLLGSGATALELTAELGRITGEECELLGHHHDGDILPTIRFATGRDAGFGRETAEARRMARDLIRSMRDSLRTNPLPTPWTHPTTDGDRR